MTYGPYRAESASLDTLTGKGEIKFKDQSIYKSSVRTSKSGRRFIKLLSPVHEIPVCAPPREKALAEWIEARYPAKTFTIAGA